AFGVVVTDVNRDRRPDIVAATVNSRARPYESRLTVLLGDRFDVASGSPFPVGPGAYQLAVGDVDEDGKPDVVTSSFEGDSIAVVLGRWPASTCFLDRRDVDLLHRHHCLEGTRGFGATSRESVGEHTRRDLPRETPAIPAPAARPLLTAVADDRVPVPI